jgi:phosphatidylglycerol:prolipoprotein diacylglycerol transferase
MYGLLISIGGILAFLISERAVKERGLNLRLFYSIVNITIIGGVIGARFYHVIDYWSFYKEHLWQIGAIWKGGLGIFGGIIGGFIFASAALLYHKQNLVAWLDALVVGLPLAQAIGRWGNFFNKELYGPETSLPWGIDINGKKYHPLFLYESLLDLLLFLGLQFMWRRENQKEKKQFPNGMFFWLYISIYGLIRIFLQPLR